MKLTRELVRRFENHYANDLESLMRASLAEPGNREGYAFYRDGSIRATASTNPHAGWGTCAYGLTGKPADNVRRAIGFFREHRTNQMACGLNVAYTAAWWSQRQTKATG